MEHERSCDRSRARCVGDARVATAARSSAPGRRSAVMVVSRVLRAASLLFCVFAAGCAARPLPPLPGPSSAPVMETPARVALVSAPRGDAEWNALGDEAGSLLSRYLRINTTNPPGNEIAAARWLAAVLRRDG